MGGVRVLRLRRALAVNAGRGVGAASRRLGRGGGTALPGLVATRLDPALVQELARQLEAGVVTISGTNGKTTTARLLAGMLRTEGYAPLRNDAGSNLMRGLATALVRHASLSGNITTPERSIGLFEVDEAALPEVLASVSPSTVLLLDLFRDQLDRYGEVATIARLWSAALAELPPATGVTINADDPQLVAISERVPGTVRYFGVDEVGSSNAILEHAVDVKACPRCGGRITYSWVNLGHLGGYLCSQCGLRRPEPMLKATNVRLNGIAGGVFTLQEGAECVPVNFPLPGLYNVYNAVAAASVAREYGVRLARIAESLRDASPAFGRMERIDAAGHQLIVALAKNPAGLNEVMRTLVEEGGNLHLLVLLNDLTADGHDVSWIWDADVELLSPQIASVVFGGIRAADMALRFKYAGALDGRKTWDVVESIELALDRATALTPTNEQLFILPTYTAMLAVRKVLARRGYVQPYWET